MVAAGSKEVPFRLERPAETVVSGEATPRWLDRGLWWGQLEGVTSANRGGLTSDVEFRIVGEYRPDLTPRWRLRDGTRIYGILSAVPINRRRDLLILATLLVGLENATT